MTIRYILGNPAITAPIPGLACVEEVDNMVEALKDRRRLTKVELQEMDRINKETWANLPTKYQWLRDWEYV
jgi:aryl-alcohol dehydrogenase-like predicted oxidoreductase